MTVFFKILGSGIGDVVVCKSTVTKVNVHKRPQVAGEEREFYCSRIMYDDHQLRNSATLARDHAHN